ncbi:transposable element Tc1 transposase [Trichonephila clavipes]|nr:transposable element Tc1 transposase [Trichonephila clavipes]
MPGNDRTPASKQLAARWSAATGVLMSASSIRLLNRGLRAMLPLYRIPFTTNPQWLHESRFNLRYHDDRIRVRRYAGRRCLLECLIERHRGLTPGVIVWGTFSYHGRSNLIRIEGNFNSNRYLRGVLQSDVVPFP